MIGASGDQQQRRTIGVLEVELQRGARVEVGERSFPQDPPRSGHGVALERGARLVVVHRVRERVVELVEGQGDSAMPVGRALQDREAGPHVENGSFVMPRTPAASIADAGRAEPAVEQDLGEGAAEGVAHDDRWRLELADPRLVAVEDLSDAELVDRARVGAAAPRPGDPCPGQAGAST